MSGRASPYRRLSESPLWSAQRTFYRRAGVDAWRTGTVPHHVTSNVAMATAYARVVLAFARERPSPEPLHVVELGAGSGRFAFLFLRALERLAPDARIRYVMTDVADATIASWRRHPALAPLFRAGRLDLARLDAERDRGLTLQRARRTIGAGAPVRRVVVIANYVFSGLRHEAFAVRDGTLHDYVVSARVGVRADDVTLRWQLGGRAAPYPEEDFNAVLGTYTRAGRFLFPAGALRCLDHVAGLATDGVLVLAADRGTTSMSGALGVGDDLDLGRHGAVSFPVNFHAVRAWVGRRGGRTLGVARRPRHVHVTGFLLGPGAWRRTRAAYDAALGADGPDALYAERRRLSAARTVAARQALALMRRCGPDPRVIAECARPLWPHLADAGPAVRARLRDAVVAAWPNYFHLGEAYDVPFTLALLLYEVRAWAEARTLFAASLRLYGDDGATLWNLGLCHVALGAPHAANRCFARARTLAPALPGAGLALTKTRSR